MTAREIESLATRVIAYGFYIACSIGLAVSLGAPWGFATGVLCAGVPAAYFLRKVDYERLIVRDKAKHGYDAQGADAPNFVDSRPKFKTSEPRA